MTTLLNVLRQATNQNTGVSGDVISNLANDINYIKKGEGKPVIFLHGWGQNINSFSPMIDSLSKTHTVWAIDFPGFGESSEPDFPYTIYDYNIFNRI